MCKKAPRYTAKARANGANCAAMRQTDTRARGGAAVTDRASTALVVLLATGATRRRLPTPQPEHAQEESRQRRLHSAGDQCGTRDDDPERVRVIQTPEAGCVPGRQGVDREAEA